MRKVWLCILDGFGYRQEKFGNATVESNYIWELFESEQSALLNASERYVGLPDGQFGNSEVGHFTIGSGRILKQKLVMIDDAISSGELRNNKTLNAFVSKIKNNTCHLLGLFSSGGVHSDINHFFWAIQFLRSKGISVKAHIFLDGRDVGYRDGLKTLSEALESKKILLSEIATIQGRFFAMDRDKRWERTKKAFEAIVHAKAGMKSSDPLKTIQAFYAQDINDETIPPFVIDGYFGASPSDAFWMLNFRTDRIKQILEMLIQDNFKVLNMVSCGEEIDQKSEVIFKPVVIKNTLGEVLAQNYISQIRVAETEKYAHVTYFFNGGQDIQYDREDRVLVPSPKVSDYSETPDMSSKEISEHILKALQSDKYKLIVSNFASPDMVGHTGNFKAVCKAIECLEAHLRRLIPVALKNDFYVIITADHGNAEYMIAQDGSPIKTHTCSKVPFILLQKQKDFIIENKIGTLADIAPTVLNIMGLNSPTEFSGKTLLKN